MVLHYVEIMYHQEFKRGGLCQIICQAILTTWHHKTQLKMNQVIIQQVRIPQIVQLARIRQRVDQIRILQIIQQTNQVVLIAIQIVIDK